MNINQRLKRRRQELGISQDELAQYCGFYHRSNISKLEAGSLKWKWNDAIKACELLHLEVIIQEAN